MALFDFAVGDVEQVELLAVVVGDGDVEGLGDGQFGGPVWASVLGEGDGLVELDGGHSGGYFGGFWQWLRA